VENPPKKENKLKGTIRGLFKHGDSLFWAGLMGMKKYFFYFGSFLIKMAQKLDSMRTSGRETPHSRNNI
jgi:hypothetical protein